MNGRNDYAESLLVHFRRVESLRSQALSYPAINLDPRRQCDLELLLNRAFYPLAGYLGQADYQAVLEKMRLADGTLWPMPVCLDVDAKTAAQLTPGSAVALNDAEGFLLAILQVSEIWPADKRQEARLLYGTEDPEAHPGVRRLLHHTAEYYVAGTLEGLSLPIHYDFTELRMSPAEIHRRFYQNGWRRVIGYHSDDYIHRAELEAILAAGREVGANIFLQPVIRPESLVDMDHYTRIRCCLQVVPHFPRNMTQLAILPLAARDAGPREALWHALIRKNYGCSHMLIADDHGDPLAKSQEEARFYPRGAAQELVRAHEDESGIVMVPLTRMAYVEEKAQYLPEAQISDAMTVRRISPEELRRRLATNLEVPAWFTYPEVVRELQYAFPPRCRQGFTIFFTGLSGSGKSTLAKVLFTRFKELRDRPVTLLDGDIVRRNLSSELTYSKEHRNLNITRIGFVASEITKNGGIAICAPIAPYEESRHANRELISRYGGYIEVYVATPLEVCEMRDRKGLYARARAGKVKGVTGVSDPYIPPANPELVIDTTDISPPEAAQEVMLYLSEQGYLK